MGKPYDELTISDDFMFFKVMTNRPDLCKELLELILGKKIQKVKFPEGQKVIDIKADAKSIRLDVYTEDEADVVYNVEMQVADTGELPKRTRYYQGLIDLNLIEKGESYRHLKKSYVIFICKFDLFGKKQYVYTFENQCIEVPGLFLGDDTYKVFLNADGVKGNISAELKSFLDLVKGLPPTGKFASKVQEQVEESKANTEWRSDYMTLLMRDQENQEIGRRIGREEGRQEGERRLSILINRLIADNRSDEIPVIVNDETAREKMYAEYNL